MYKNNKYFLYKYLNWNAHEVAPVKFKIGSINVLSQFIFITQQMPFKGP